MPNDILGKIFNSPHRVKIIRLFFLNPQTIFETAKDIAGRTKSSKSLVRREILMLQKISFIKRASRGKKEGFQLNPSFLLLRPLKNLLLNAAPFSKSELLEKLKPIGRLKLVIISGIFQDCDDSRIDLFIVADSIRRITFKKILKDIEAKIGKELDYAIMGSGEFNYRTGMYDKFIREIFDAPHEKILNKLNI